MRRALCVGIDAYEFGDLRGCVSDANAMFSALTRNEDGSPNFECKSLIADKIGQFDKVTAAILRQSIEELFKHEADVALLHFSGHGTVNDLDGFLVTQDAKRYSEGLPMSHVLQLANNSRATEAIVILDCCSSGQLGNAPIVDNRKAMLREGVSILTASRGDQESVEVNGGGVFTSLVVDAIRGGAADLLGNVSTPGIYSFVEAALGAWDQRPLFKAHLAKLVPIRKCKPAIETTILRELPRLFPLPAEDLRLAPEFEMSCERKDDEKVSVFCKLQALAKVHLVVPVGAIHMYDAAMKSKACRLTDSGRYFWRLAKEARI